MSPTLRRRWRLLLSIPAVLIASGAAACSAATEEDDSADYVSEELESTTELSAADRKELSGAGFDDDEIKAVADSVAISKLLAVKSFVQEANDGTQSDPPKVRRESHGKAQGCLRARVDVKGSPNVGAFQSGASYPAWVRLSNGGAYQKSDKAQHISRGWGIKLLDVPSTSTGTHDFLFITSPRFFISDITHYPSFLRSSGNGRKAFILNALFRMSWEEKEVIVHRMGLKVANLLESPEYSAVPYAYGDKQVKYAVAPCGIDGPPTTPESRPPPSDASEDYLQDAMNATLESADRTKGVCYAFYVQQRRDDKDSVDNPTKAWGGEFEEIATVTFPYGQHRGGPADYQKNEDECERMAFDPFNTTSASKPLGKANWTRKFVYPALARFRREELPKLYARWLVNRGDASVPEVYRKELARLRDADKARPTFEETTEPTYDEGFAKLGIAR